MQNSSKNAYKQTRVYKNAHKKLMSAIAMLLVASILMASSTYAWFTLSTSPEVTGITTTVGSNGSLEIALVSDDSATDADKVGSAVGSSSAVTDVTEANITWGNLVELDDTSYGLQNVTLNLAAFAGTNGSTIEASEVSGSLETSLAYAVYGADGRVASLATSLTSAAYETDESGNSGFTLYTEASGTTASGYGVRVLGTTGTVTTGVSGWLTTAKKAVTNNYNTALSNVKSALTKSGVVGMAAAQATNSYSDDAAVGNSAAEYISNIKTALNYLISANAAMESMVKNAILAYVCTTSYADTLYSTLSNMELSDIIAAVSGDGAYAGTLGSATAISGLVAVYTAIQSMETTIGSASDEYDSDESATNSIYAQVNNLDASTVTWGELMTIAKLFVNTTCLLTINSNGNVLGSGGTALASAYLTGNLSYAMLVDGSGIFYDYGALLGSYDITISSPVTATLKVVYTSSYSGSTLTTSSTSGSLETLKSTVAGYTAYVSEDSGSETETETTTEAITEFYAYILDFWFRSNADGTLKLQTDAALRVNSDETASSSGADDAVTQGSGSYIELSGDMTESAYLSAITVVFMDGDGNYLATATPVTTASASEDADEADADGEANADDEEEAGETTTSTSSKIVATYDEASNTTKVYLECDSIVALAANTAERVSVLVYIDGGKITNADASTDEGVTFTLNLQFATTADLTAMSYGAYNVTSESSSDDSEDAAETNDTATETE